MIAQVLPRLYLLTDRHQTVQRSLDSVLTQALGAGVRLLQIREKDLPTRDLCQLAQTLSPLFATHQAQWLINDRVDLVLALNASGVHLRTSSLPTGVVRQLLGPHRLIGVSTHSHQEVLAAERESADFAILGPVFDTPSKRMYGQPLGLKALERTCRTVQIPVFAIGGVTPDRVPELRKLGAYGVAVISSILQAPDVFDTTQRFLDLLA